MSTDSQIISEIDLDANGKHTGYLRLPHSVHRSAYGWLPVPIGSVRNGEGPVALLMSGNHGDEYEGQIVLPELLRQLEPNDISGQLIVLPMANFPAADAGLRTSPIDQGNLNRTFPGRANGTPTEMLAHYIEHELLQRSDYLLDVHSGGSSLMYDPSMLMQNAPDATTQSFYIELMESIGFTNGLFYPPVDSGTYSSSAAHRKNAVPITIEAAGGGTVTVPTLHQLRQGIPNYLRKIGILGGEVKTFSSPTRVMNVIEADYCYADQDGLFEPAVDLLDEVEAGQVAGFIHTPKRPMEKPQPVVFLKNGVVVCKRVPAMVRHGDCLFHLAEEIA
ncbi:MAG: succinylglutamate desuccinylase/aspartoacylase family protein [Pseudomonadota bacterium]